MMGRFARANQPAAIPIESADFVTVSDGRKSQIKIGAVRFAKAKPYLRVRHLTRRCWVSRRAPHYDKLFNSSFFLAKPAVWGGV